MKLGKDFWITFGLAFLLTMAVQGYLFPNNQEKKADLPSALMVVTPAKETFHLTDTITLNIKAGSGAVLPLSLPFDCPNEPFDVYRDNVQIKSTTTTDCGNDNKKELTLTDQGLTISYGPWHKDLFAAAGSYEIRVPYNGTTYNAHFKVEGDSFIGNIWNQVFNRPLYNLLIGLTALLGHSLGWAIVALTILIKLILFIPTLHSMENQRKMQLVQPKLKEIQKKYKDNKQMQSLETMRILKEHKVNPMGSCLPILIQIPVLIALFYAVQNGLSIPYSLNLYPFLASVDITKINPIFLGLLDLSKVNIWVIPLLVGGLQYFQMKLALPKTDISKLGAKEKVIEQKEDGSNIFAEAMPDMNQMGLMMTYVMPVMIALMSASFPSGVGIYWAMQSILGIAQQQYVNKMKLKIT